MAIVGPNGEVLIDFAHTIYHEHLGESIDACIRSLRSVRLPDGRRPRERRASMTCVLHAFACIEGIANAMFYELYLSPTGKHYRPVALDNAKLVRTLCAWKQRRLNIEKRYEHLLAALGRKIDRDLYLRLGDLAALRHALAHGTWVDGVMLSDPGVDRVHRVEVDATFVADYRCAQFSPIDKLVSSDAEAGAADSA